MSWHFAIEIRHIKSAANLWMEIPSFCTGMEKKYMTYEEAIKTIQPGRYRLFKGNEYEVVGIARHSETEEPMVVYRALYGDGGLPARENTSVYHGDRPLASLRFRRRDRQRKRNIHLLPDPKIQEKGEQREHHEKGKCHHPRTGIPEKCAQKDRGCQKQPCKK